MNGEVNGMVEDSLEMPVAEPDSTQNTKIVISENCNDTVNNCETTLPETNDNSDAKIESSAVECPVNGTDIDMVEAPIASKEFDNVISEEPIVKAEPSKSVEDSNQLEDHRNNSEDKCTWLQGFSDIEVGNDQKDDTPTDLEQKDDAPTENDHKDEASTDIEQKDDAPTVNDHKDEASTDIKQKHDAPTDNDHKDEASTDIAQKDDAPTVNDHKDEASTDIKQKDDAPTDNDHKDEASTDIAQKDDAPTVNDHKDEASTDIKQKDDVPTDNDHKDEASTDIEQKDDAPTDNGHEDEASTDIKEKDDAPADTIQDPEEGDQDRPENPETSEAMESDGVHSIVDSSDESEVSAGPRAEDTVSINSDSGAEGGDDTSQESQTKLKTSELLTIGKEKRPSNQNGGTCGSPSPEVKEIVCDNDQSVKKSKPAKVPENKVALRRSSRAIKRIRYDNVTNGDDDSDVEEISESYRRRSRPIVINDTKTLVEMAARQMKSHQGHSQKKETQVVIIDSNSGRTPIMQNQIKKASALSSTSTMSTQSLYQSIVARGTTVTPVPTKTNASTQSPQALILPSLTDDMFVVEAPSFIVPYVYEKPSIKPFREFVDVLGNELAEQKAKEEKAEQEKLQQERKDKIARGEIVENSAEESVEKESEKGASTSTEKETSEKIKDSTETEETETDEDKKKKKADKRERRKRQNDDDDMSWDGESSLDSDDEVGSDEEGKTVVIKDKVDAVTDLKDVTDLTVEKIVSGKSDNYFDCSLGKFFMNIGLNLVQEYVQNDLLKQQTRKLQKEKKTGQDTKSTEISIMSLKKNIEFSKNNNAPYSFPKKKCELCSFKSESELVLAQHMETPHMKNNVYKCNFCEFENRCPHDILLHVQAEHKIRGRLERAPSYHMCPNCPFEDNSKGKLVRHQIACAKKFKPDTNLSPPVDWEPPAKIPKQLARSRNHMMSAYHNSFHRGLAAGHAARPTVGQMVQGAAGYRPRGRSPMGVPPRAALAHGAPLVRGGVVIRQAGPGAHTNYPVGNNGKSIPLPKSLHQPSISITPLPRQSAPPAPAAAHAPPKNTCVICEICDGYIKDLEQLRNHMQWIHKVKIHPKMIHNRPPLNCQKCQFRFFTDQGLERHLLGSHGLVTSSMQDAANKGKDAGRCPVCGRIYQWKLLNHVSHDHNLTLKPAHLSYKCTVCTATFDMYKQFESHVYSAHSVMKTKANAHTPIPPKQSVGHANTLKPLKINDEITIIPQPVKPAAAAAEGSDK